MTQKHQVLIQVRLTKDLSVEKVDETAKQLGLSRSALGVKGLKFLTEWDPNFIETVEKWADNLQVKPATFVENIVLDWLARLSGEMAVFGPTQQVMPEFLHRDGELLKGKAFYEKRRQDYIQHFSQQLAQRDAERDKAAREG